MRVALLISGEMRTFDEFDLLARLFLCLITPLKCDVFVSTWSHRGVSYHHGHPIVPNNINSEITESLLKQTYRHYLKGIEIESFNNFLATLSPRYKSLYETGYEWQDMKIKGTSVPQLYKMQRANQLKRAYETKHNFIYDLVIRTRPDNEMLDYLPLRYVSDLTAVYGINCPGTYYPLRIYDIFYFSNSGNMDKMAEAYDQIEALIADPFDNGMHKEDTGRLLYVQAKQQKIKVVDMDFVPCIIRRGEEQKQR